MRKPKLKRYPKKPKASASLAVLQRYLHRVEEIDRENAGKISNYKESKKLAGRIAGIKPKHHNWDVIKTYTRKPTVKKHKRRVSGHKRKKR